METTEDYARHTGKKKEFGTEFNFNTMNTSSRACPSTKDPKDH